MPAHLTLSNEVVEASDAARPELPRLSLEVDFERSPDGPEALLVGAGLRLVETTQVEFDWRVRPADFLVGVASVGNFGVLWRAQSPLA